MSPPRRPSSDRQSRLSEALRDNLLKRKAQARGRAAAGELSERSAELPEPRANEDLSRGHGLK